MAVRTGLLPRLFANQFTLRVKLARFFVVCLLWNSVAIELTVWVSWIMVAADTFVVAVPTPFPRTGVVIGRGKVIVFNFGVVVVIRGIGIDLVDVDSINKSSSW